MAYIQEVVVPLEFIVPNVCLVLDHILDYNVIIKNRLEKVMSLDELMRRDI